MLTNSQISSFKEKGYLVVEDLFTSGDLFPIKTKIEEMVEQKVQQLYQSGRIQSLYQEEPFEYRLAKIASVVPGVADETVGSRDVNKSEVLFQFMKHPKILGLMESIVGADILCHPSYNIEPRMPQGWTVAHQDAGYYLPDGDNTLIVTCWIPLVDATLENGCLWVAPFYHKQGVMRHVKRKVDSMTVLEIPFEDLPKSKRIPIPLNVGGILLFSSMLPHGSLLNSTETIRWSLDLRYQALSKPTGRWYVPGFVAQSRSNPNLENYTYETWVAEVNNLAKAGEQQLEKPRYRYAGVEKAVSGIYSTDSISDQSEQGN